VVQDYNGLRQLFLKHGTVKNINVPVNPMNSIPRGFAFVTLSSAEEAEKGARPLASPTAARIDRATGPNTHSAFPGLLV
jgi:hypothetical protein